MQNEQDKRIAAIRELAEELYPHMAPRMYDYHNERTTKEQAEKEAKTRAEMEAKAKEERGRKHKDIFSAVRSAADSDEEFGGLLGNAPDDFFKEEILENLGDDLVKGKHQNLAPAIVKNLLRDPELLKKYVEDPESRFGIYADMYARVAPRNGEEGQQGQPGQPGQPAAQAPVKPVKMPPPQMLPNLPDGGLSEQQMSALSRI